MGWTEGNCQVTSWWVQPKSAQLHPRGVVQLWRVVQLYGWEKDADFWARPDNGMDCDHMGTKLSPYKTLPHQLRMEHNKGLCIRGKLTISVVICSSLHARGTGTKSSNPGACAHLYICIYSIGNHAQCGSASQRPLAKEASTAHGVSSSECQRQ